MQVSAANISSKLEAETLSSAKDQRLTKAAHDFEASLMSELLKPLQHDSLTSDNEDGEEQGSGGALGDFASESLARSLSEHGGFGIARRILEHFHPASDSGPKN